METSKPELKLIQMSDVDAEEVSWLWYPFIPYGKLTIVHDISFYFNIVDFNQKLA